MAIRLHELPSVLDREIDAALLQRAGRALFYLESKFRQAYLKEFHSSSGSRGAVGAITSSLQAAEAFLAGEIGVGDQGKHLAYREFGVKPAEGALYPAMTRIPPVRSIYDYLRLARFAIPQGFKDLAESRTEDSEKPWYSNDPLMLWAFSKAQRIKREGVKPLRVIERTARAHAKRLEEILDGK